MPDEVYVLMVDLGYERRLIRDEESGREDRMIETAREYRSVFTPRGFDTPSVEYRIEKGSGLIRVSFQEQGSKKLSDSAEAQFQAIESRLRDKFGSAAVKVID